MLLLIARSGTTFADLQAAASDLNVFGSLRGAYESAEPRSFSTCMKNEGAADHRREQTTQCPVCPPGLIYSSTHCDKPLKVGH
jgi:hypothetical protein